MKSIIEKLFYDEIEQNTFPKENKLSKDENEIFEKLRSGLTDEQKSLLIEFDDLKNERLLEDEKELYILGFWTGAKALMEILYLKLN